MKKLMLTVGAVAALSTGGWMAMDAQPDEMPAGMPDMEQMLDMMDKMSKPDTEHHALMKKLVNEKHWRLRLSG